MDGLTARETEVLQLVATGLTYKEIARRLGISSRTARNHVTHLFDKLGVGNRTQAVLAGARLGLVELG